MGTSLSVSHTLAPMGEHSILGTPTQEVMTLARAQTQQWFPESRELANVSAEACVELT